MKRTLIVVASLLVVTGASGCGTAENPMGPTMARTAPGVETSVGTLPIDGVPSEEDGFGMGAPETFDPVNAQDPTSGRKKPKKDHPVHPTHPGSFDPEDTPVRH